MYIKSIMLDGFKSYGRRTDITGFDQEFNAITGLNGTGKSNILDSICFVLGISNLGQVRATSLQDLVYKSGQAGIKKATVTITFDNSDLSQCPIGYEKCKEISVTRQVIVGGKNKYLINGKNVLNKKVNDLFCSVQLNINNPNFLIMQGRITKVLNMKPQEILSMIEEAAGTSMYESKREITVKNLEKKEAKLCEMNTLLHDEIEPKLEKLRRERAIYIEYQKICNDLDYLTRIHISHKYLQYQQSLNSFRTGIEAIEQKIGDDRNTIKCNEEESVNLEQQAKEIEKRIDEESGGILNELEEEMKKVSKDDALVSSEKKSAKDNIDDESKRLKTLEKNIRDDQKALDSKNADMVKFGNTFEVLKQTDANDEKAFLNAQKRFEAVAAGLSTNEEGEALSLQDQLMAAQAKISEASTTIKKSEMEIKQLNVMIKTKERDSMTGDANYIKDKRLCDQLTGDVSRMNSELSRITYREGHLEQLQESQMALNQELRNIKKNLDSRAAHRFEMQYRDPEPNFDRRKVKGMVCKLFEVKDKKYCMALGIAAGGSLYNVVVNTDETSKKILERGQLQSRTTFIPMNKITGRAIEANVVKFAQNLVGPENVDSALNLIDYEEELDPVMKYVFGRTLICRDMNIAKQVTYHKNIMCRTVTLEGDVLDPDGSLSGGSAPKGGAILLAVGEIIQFDRMMKEKQNELQAVHRELQNVEQTATRYNQLKEQLELRTCELNKIQQTLSQTSFQQAKTDVENMKAKLQTLKESIEVSYKTQATESAKAKNIESKLSDSKGHRERELKSAEQDMKLLKKKHEESRKNWKKREQEYETLKLEIEELSKSIEASKQQHVQSKEAIVKLEQAYEAVLAKCKNSSEAVEELKIKIKEQKTKINSQNRELKHKMSTKDKLLKMNQDLVIAIKKKENEITNLKSENKDALNRINGLERKYEWIADDKEQFGVPHSRYDYNKHDPIDAGNQLTLLAEKKTKMGRNINQKAMTLLQREEEQFRDVVKRIERVENDKKSIFKIINNFDEKKKQSVMKAWREVNTNFGSIFSTLLPGAFAKLVPPEGIPYYEGLEVKVSFNGLWKESLTELSGGQRSLVALSLILAMLKFKPAPLYILDEVDAALDLSHTQNIGNMLKVHFKNSQFIVVSLKDGMFNNANVLFSTKFIDGMSGIQRTVNMHNKTK